MRHENYQHSHKNIGKEVVIHMRKRILASILALTMVFTMMPATAYADEQVSDNTEVVQTDESTEAAEATEVDAGNVEATEAVEAVETTEAVEVTEMGDTTEAAETTLAEESMEAGNEAVPLSELSAVTLKNDGYPYGKDMTSSQVTLVMEADNASSYQWMSASSKYGTYTNIEGATGSTYTINSPITGTWYKCSVNGNESKAVETVYPEQDGRTWTKPYESWYISNGTMAYMVNRTYFDVTGLYTKNGVNYMLCTSFNRCWRLFSSTSANPDAGDQTDDLLDALRVSFNESDAYDIVFEADLADGHQAFSFGCDTQLGSSATSGDYYDYAALQALIKNGNLKQVSMIGSATVAGAQDDEPAFVIAPVTDNSMFWIGYYSDRKTYAYNNSSTSTTVKKTETINGKEVATLFEGGDSGMTMSWTNLVSGSSVKFRFCVGSVKDTGAINGKVNYVKETLIDLEPSTVYEVTCDGTTYTITSNSDGELALSGNDNNGNEYDFVGKTITIKKVNGDEDAANIDVAGRPTTPQQPSDMAGDSSDTPELVDKIEIVEMTENSVSISPVEGQEYAYSTDGEHWTTLTNADIDTNGYYKASGLTGGKVYIRTRISATKSKPASAWSDVTVLSLKQTIKAGATGYNGTYDGAEHTAITVTPEEADATVTYSTTADGTYSPEVPEIKNAGTYTVYYRVEKAGYYPSCGSVKAVISGYPLSVSWSNIEFTYDGTSKLPTAELVGSPLAGEECSLSVSLSPDSYYSQAVEAGTYTACAYLSNSNYIISSGETQGFTINKANRDTAPELTGIAETISGKKDGKIEGLVAWDMEYRKITSSEEDGSQNGYNTIYNSDMTFESGTYEVRYCSNRNYNVSPSTTVTIDAGRMLDITLPEDQPGYTITSSESQVGWDGAVDLTLTLEEGYHVDGDLPVVMANGEALTVTEKTDETTGKTYTVRIENIEADQTITVSGIVDEDLPTGQIKIGDEICNGFVEAGDINYDNIINGSLHVEIDAEDETSGIKSREYYVYIPADDKAGLSLDEVKALDPAAWTEGEAFDIDSDTKCVIYVKITDKSGNVTYISSNGIIVDNEAPVISGLTEGGIYCQNIEFTVTDANLKSVTYQLENGESVELFVSDDGRCVLPVADIVSGHDIKDLVVTATDGAGNDTQVSIKLGHEYTEMTFAPTVLDKGYTMYVCEHTAGGLACADTYKDNYVDALGVSGLVPNDKDGLESIVSEAGRKLESDTLSDDDKAFYNEVLDKASDMLEDIEQAEEIITELDGMDIADIENPTANDSDKLNDALTKIDKLLDADDETSPTQSLTDAQKEELEKLRDDINDKLDLIADVADGLEEIEKGTSTEPGVDTINKITDIKPADQENIESVLSKLEDYLDKYEDNLTDEQKDKAESDYEQMLDKLKEAAKKDVDQKLESIEKQIEAAVSDPEEKAEAISKAAEEAEKAKADIDKAQTRADVTAERDGGKENLENITGTVADFRETIKDNIENIFAEKKSEIEAMTDLTDSEKADAISRLEEEKQKVFETIDGEKLKDDIINSTEDIESEFDTIVSDASQTDLSNAKESAKADIDKKAEDAKLAIDKMADLTDSEKKEAKAAIDEKAKAAKEAIDGVTDPSQKDSLASQKDAVSVDIDKCEADASDKNTVNSGINAEKAETAAGKTTDIIGDIKAGATDKEDIIAEIKKELEAADIDNADVDISDYTKVPASLHEAGKITGTVEITVGGTTKTVEISKELPKLSSYVTYESTVASDAPKAEVSVDSDALMEKVLGDEALQALADGGNADIVLDVQNKDTEVTAAEAEVIADKLAEGAKVGKYLDISLFLNIVDSDGTTIIDNEKIHEAETSFTIKISVPDELIASGDVTRTYQIVRVHDGVAEILESVYDENEHTLTFETDRFSTYAIAYTDTEKKAEVPSTPAAPSESTPVTPATADVQSAAASNLPDKSVKSAPKTGDDTQTGLYIMLVLAGIGMLIVGRKKNYNR